MINLYKNLNFTMLLLPPSNSILKKMYNSNVIMYYFQENQN